MYNDCEHWTAREKCARWNAQFAGKPALITRSEEGYFTGQIFGRNVVAHRAAYAIHHGHWPKKLIDHIDQDPTNNRISNLRDVDQVENQRNRKRQANNSTGVTGVCWNKSHGRWHSYIKLRGKQTTLGFFEKFEDAVLARKDAELEYGFSPRHGQL